MSEESHGTDRILRIWNGHPFNRGQYCGSGFAIDQRHVLTCHHVIASEEAADPASLSTNLYIDGAGLPTPLSVERIWTLAPRTDRESDLALLEVRAPPLISSALTWSIAPANSCLDKGDNVDLLGYGDVRESARKVNADIRGYYPQLASYIVSAMVPKGMSGGPAVHSDQVVGITKTRESKSGEVDLVHCSLAHELMAIAGMVIAPALDKSQVKVQDLFRLSEEDRVEFVRKFPIGPPVDPLTIPPVVPTAFVNGHDNNTSKQTIRYANRLRSLADPDLSPEAITLDYVSPDHSPSRSFWESVLVSACQLGPRMLASLVASAPPTVTSGIESKLENILSELRRIKR